MALVLTLLLLLAATAIILTFFLRARFDYQASHGYSTGVQADMLAAGAMDSIVAKTVEEIADANHSETPAAVDSQLTWFAPKNANGTYPTMLPDRNNPQLGSWDSSSPYRNLIKQSLPGKAYYNGGDTSEVSGVLTTTKSTDGRFVNGARWSLPKLIGDDTGVKEFSDSEVPAWIYVQANGKPTNSSSGKDAAAIVGRYAYNVYDVGGLLNINAAGNDGANDSDIGAKGALALADLTKIPGLDAGSAEKILKWRAPYVNWSDTGDPNSDSIPAGNLSLLDYLRVGGASGWTRNPATSSASPGNQFLSRRDLIKFFADNNIPDQALPYLTQFNVDLDAPTFSPVDSKILPVTYSSFARLKESSPSRDDVAGKQEEINPARAENAGTYSLPSGGTETAPALHRRFPLSRLGYVKTEKSSRLKGSDDNVTQKYFGLVAEDDFTWQYKDAEGSTDHIKTLKEVAAAGREPNFFEILKSVIQVGSLGQHKQKLTTQQQITSPRYNVEPNANVIDEQILRIGAAIIDQADEDSYPTRILFNDTDGDLTSFGEIYGVENLPYLYFIRVAAYRLDDKEYHRSVIIQPTLWDPHNPFRIDRSKDFPSEFVVQAKSQSGSLTVLGTWWNTIKPKSFNGETISFHWKPTQPTKDQPNFFEPQGILSAGYPTTAAPITFSSPEMTRSLWTDSQHGEIAKQAGISTFPAGQASGFVIGDTSDDINDPTNPPKLNKSFSLYGGCVEFQLKYRVGSKDYTYDRLWFPPALAKHLDFSGNTFTFTTYESGNKYPFSSTKADNDGNDSTPARGDDNRIDAGYAKTDPRSQRFMWVITRADFSNKPATGWGVLKEGQSLSYYDGVVGHSYSAPMLDYDDKLWTIGKRVDGRDSTHQYLRTDLGLLSYNSDTLLGERGMYYRDPDGVVRRALVKPSSTIYYYGAELGHSVLDGSTKATNIGFPMQRRVDYGTDLAAFESRPVILNRPFRSVGELAYAYRDVPWKNVDLSLPESGDTGLLDAFCVNETEGPADSVTPLRADKVNLNTASKPVLEALVSGAAKQLNVEGTTGLEKLTDSQESKIVDRFVQYRGLDGAPSEKDQGVNGPLSSLSEIVGRLYSGSNGDSAMFVGLHPEAVMGSPNEDKILAERLSTISRSLPDMGTVRTWNFMVDLVVQTGKVVDGSTDLEKFSVNSESRWWMFVSIDRFTGKVLSRSFERIVE